MGWLDFLMAYSTPSTHRKEGGKGEGYNLYIYIYQSAFFGERGGGDPRWPISAYLYILFFQIWLCSFKFSFDFQDNAILCLLLSQP